MRRLSAPAALLAAALLVLTGCSSADPEAPQPTAGDITGDTSVPTGDEVTGEPSISSS